MADIVISEFMDQDAVDSLTGDFDVHYGPDLVDDAEALKAALAGSRALIVRNRTQVRGDVLAAGDALEVVGRLGVGLDNIDVAACEGRGIEVCPASGANADAVGEYVIAAAMMLLRQCYHGYDAMVAGAWPRAEMQGCEVGGRLLGLVGFGTISRVTARMAKGLGMRIAAYDPMVAADDPAWAELGVSAMELEPLLAESDVVSLHVPLIDATRHLIDAGRLKLMKPDAVLINTARGGVVDDAAVAAALRDGRLGGAALDVFEGEPVPADNPFAATPNLILTPHVAGVTYDSNIRVSAVTAANVRRVLSGG
jgi:(S)-sulfolactate dehydrogenase